MPPPRLHGSRTGHVDLLAYDQAVAEGLGAVLDPVKRQYYVSLLNAQGKGIFVRPEGSDAPKEITRALVVFKQSEPTHTEFDVPALIINRDDVSPAKDRLVSVAEAYRVPCEDAQQVVIGGYVGWTSYETKEQEWPFDFTYTIEAWSRYRTVAQMLHQKVMVKYPLNGKLRVVDSLGVERVYHTFTEGTADLTQVNSLVDRLVGYSLTMRVEGELTNEKIGYCVPAFTGGTVPDGGTSGGGGSGPPGPVNPDGPGEQPVPGGGMEPDALSGDGQPAKRITVIGPTEAVPGSNE
jgi:hypothetical protein